MKKYLFTILTFTAFTFLFSGLRIRAQFVGQTDAPQDLRGGKAVEYLKQTGSYDSLTEAVKDVNAANQSASDSLFVQRQKLTANDGGAQDLFGSRVAISGDTAVVGAERDQIGANVNQGSAYVFVRNGNTWTQQAKLVANDGQFDDLFGTSVAISGDTIIVGAYGDDINSNTNQGSAYVFIRNGTNWIPQEKIIAADGAAGDVFGYSVGISGDTVLIGAISDDIGANADQGSAYVFVRNGGAWTQQQKLTASDGLADDVFGVRVVVSGNTAIVTAPEDDIGSNTSQGSAYVFVRSGTNWTQQTKLTTTDGAAGDRLGYSIDLSLTFSGAVAVIGAWYDDVGGNFDQGSVYIFTRSQLGTWSQAQKLIPNDGAANDSFGFSVAVSSVSANTIIVGADSSPQSKAYVFNRIDSVWTQTQKLTPYDGGSGDRFGYSVALSGDTVLVGSNTHDVGANQNQGAVYVFNLGSANPFDFDGDGKTDISVFRPSNGQWWTYRSGDGSVSGAAFGNSTDKITPADFTGDGKTDIAVFRPSNGTWYFLRSEDNSFFSVGFGANGDVPVPADYDGDGKADQAVFRPSNGSWYLNRSSLGFTAVSFGQAGDKPVLGDYDGDGKADVAVYRSSTGGWYLNRSQDGFIGIGFGIATDKTVPADYDGDGKTDVGVYRDGNWYYLRSSDGAFRAVAFGIAADIPSAADFDGDGLADQAVFRNGNWYLNRSQAGFSSVAFGTTGDSPIPSAFVQ